jgi:hypothetical protein
MPIVPVPGAAWRSRWAPQGGEGVGEARAALVAREVEAGGVEMAGVDEQAELLGGRAHVTDQPGQLGNGLAELAPLARVLEQEPRAGRHPRDQLAELAGGEDQRLLGARVALGVAHVEAHRVEPDLRRHLEIGE